MKVAKPNLKLCFRGMGVLFFPGKNSTPIPL